MSIKMGGTRTVVILSISQRSMHGCLISLIALILLQFILTFRNVRTSEYPPSVESLTDLNTELLNAMLFTPLLKCPRVLHVFTVLANTADLIR